VAPKLCSGAGKRRSAAYSKEQFLVYISNLGSIGLTFLIDCTKSTYKTSRIL
jgi:hypothetical protein